MEWWTGMNTYATSSMTEIETGVFDPWMNCEELDLNTILHHQQQNQLHQQHHHQHQQQQHQHQLQHHHQQQLQIQHHQQQQQLIQHQQQHNQQQQHQLDETPISGRGSSSTEAPVLRTQSSADFTSAIEPNTAANYNETRSKCNTDNGSGSNNDSHQLYQTNTGSSSSSSSPMDCNGTSSTANINQSKLASILNSSSSPASNHNLFSIINSSASTAALGPTIIDQMISSNDNNSSQLQQQQATSGSISSSSQCSNSSSAGSSLDSPLENVRLRTGAETYDLASPTSSSVVGDSLRAQLILGQQETFDQRQSHHVQQTCADSRLNRSKLQLYSQATEHIYCIEQDRQQHMRLDHQLCHSTDQISFGDQFHQTLLPGQLNQRSNLGTSGRQGSADGINADQQTVVVCSKSQTDNTDGNLELQASQQLVISSTTSLNSPLRSQAKDSGNILVSTTSSHQHLQQHQQHQEQHHLQIHVTQQQQFQQQVKGQKTRRCRHITDFVLSEEEKRLLTKEGYTDFPMTCEAGPLSKSEERILRRIRRKIRNKKSAQCSRQRKKEYVEDLERKYAAVFLENNELKEALERMQQHLQINDGNNQSTTNIHWRDLLMNTKTVSVSQRGASLNQLNNVYI